MKKLTRILFLMAGILILNGCASIVSKSTYPFSVTTNPSSVNVVIKNNKGLEIYNGNSPATVKLKAGAGFFKKASYTLHISEAGFNDIILPINFGLDGWYFGNLLIGGLIGMLIIDPATGAMYRLEDPVMNINLEKAAIGDQTPSLRVYDMADIPSNLKNKLIMINP